MIDKRLRSVDQIEVPYVETKEYEYLYSAGDEHVFMDTETYDQLNFSPEIIGTAMDYLLPNSRVMVKYINDKPVSIEIPDFVELSSEGHAAIPGRCNGHQPIQGSHAGDGTQDFRSTVRQAWREDPHRYPDGRIPRASQVRDALPVSGERPVDELTRLLSDLVAIPSVNPDGAPFGRSRGSRSGFD